MHHQINCVAHVALGTISRNMRQSYMSELYISIIKARGIDRDTENVYVYN
jgi:hypothetical protein